MNPLEAFKPEDLISLSDPQYREAIKKRSRALSAKAMQAYEDVMDDTDEGGVARIMAADRIMKFSEAQDEQRLLPQGVSEEVFRLALSGLMQLRGIAAMSQGEAILRNVTPAKADPRPQALIEQSLRDDSPLNRRAEGPEASLPEVPISPVQPHERYEIIDPSLESVSRRHEEEIEDL